LAAEPFGRSVAGRGGRKTNRRVIANRQSAQRSRMRKLQYISDLEANVAGLQNDLNEMQPQVALVQSRHASASLDLYFQGLGNTLEAVQTIGRWGSYTIAWVRFSRPWRRKRLVQARFTRSGSKWPAKAG
jgi:hypothetical protein